jgi:hypothetical protein
VKCYIAVKESKHMTKSITTLLAAGFVFSLGMLELRAQDKATAEQLDKKADAVNAAAKKPGKMKAAYQSISTETGVPLERVEKLHKEHPEAGPAGLMLACVMAAETKRTPSHFIESRMDGKSWAAIAHDNKVPIEKLTERLDHMSTALASAPIKAENPKEKK